MIVALMAILVVGMMGLALLRNWAFSAEPGQRYVGTIKAFFEFVENPHLVTAGGLRWGRLPAIFSETFWTFIAAYGWQNVQISAWVYIAFGAWMLAAVAGIFVCFLRPPLRRAAWLPAALALTWVLAVALVSLYRSLFDGRFVAAGRYLAPALPALAILFALGWTSLPLPVRPQLKVATMLAPVLLVAAWGPFLYIWPVYAPPQRISTEAFAAQPDVTPADARFENGIALLGYRVETPTVTAGGAVTLTLYFTIDQSIEANYMTSLVAIGPDGQGYGFCRSTPGRDQYPTFRWEPGEVVVDRYRVPINDNFPAPAAGFFSLSFLLSETGARLPLVDDAGRPDGEYLHFGFDSYRVEALDSGGAP
jgi:hypothetical protein